MLKLARAGHVLGVVMFFGSILGHVTVGFVPGAADDPETALVVREAIRVATNYLTIPGLVLLLLTGVFMIVKGRLSVLRVRWLALHAVIGLLIALNAGAVLYPTGLELVEAASLAASGTLPMDRLQAMAGREAAFGAVNVVLSLVMVLIAVVKPGLGRKRA